LRRAQAQFSRFNGANLSQATLRDADFSHASLRRANLTDTKLRCTDLRGADLRAANLSSADFKNADLTETLIGWTRFANNDLSTAKGLDSIRHFGPSTIGIDTLFRSDGKIPDAFLRDAGVPEDFITFVPSLVGRAIEFYSCFISYSHEDDDFSRRLHSRMRAEKLRVWYAPEDMKAGRKLHEQIFRAIQIHDKLLLVLSEHSMKSVLDQIRGDKKRNEETLVVTLTPTVGEG
jgi:hypothetical protein